MFTGTDSKCRTDGTSAIRFQVALNGVATAIDCTTAGGGVEESCFDTDGISVAAGDKIETAINNTVSSTSVIEYLTITCQFVPS